MSNYKKRWTSEDKKSCIEDYNSGETIESLSYKYGRSIGGIIVLLTKEQNIREEKIIEPKNKKEVKEKKDKKEVKEKKDNKKNKKEKKETKNKKEIKELLIDEIENMKEDYNNGIKLKDMESKYGYKGWYIIAAIYDKKLETNEIRSKTRSKWTNEDLDYLLSNCYQKSVEELAEDLERSEKAIICRLIIHGIYDINE